MPAARLPAVPALPMTMFPASVSASVPVVTATVPLTVRPTPSFSEKLPPETKLPSCATPAAKPWPKATEPALPVSSAMLLSVPAWVMPPMASRSSRVSPVPSSPPMLMDAAVTVGPAAPGAVAAPMRSRPACSPLIVATLNATASYGAISMVPVVPACSVSVPGVVRVSVSPTRARSWPLPAATGALTVSPAARPSR